MHLTALTFLGLVCANHANYPLSLCLRRAQSAVPQLAIDIIITNAPLVNRFAVSILKLKADAKNAKWIL